MKAEFCRSCGARMEYSFAPPNFCGTCGKRMGNGPSVNEHSSEKEPQRTTEESEEEAQVPAIASLDYNVDYEGSGPRIIKFEELATQKNEGEVGEVHPGMHRMVHRSKAKPKDLPSREEVLRQSVEECKSVGKTSSRDIGG